MNAPTNLTGDALAAFCARLATAVPEHAGMIAASPVDAHPVPAPVSLGHVAVYDVTVQWSIIGPSLNRSAHDKGDHGYGSLIRGGYGARFSFHHNLWANHRARMPRPGNYNDPAIDPIGPVIEFRSNVFYNWAGAASGYNVDKGARATYAFVDNAYIPGPDSTGRLAGLS